MNPVAKIRAWMRVVREHSAITAEAVLDTKMLTGRMLAKTLETQVSPISIQQAEFKVFSQFGEDGIIQYLVRRAKIPSHLATFVEFGVESYTEANTRFLLMNDNWRGLIMDGSEANMAAVQASALYWKYDLTAKAAFIDRDNIDQLITDAGFAGEIGLLSIDIDGNDYWVWEQITAVNPVLVIVEYNSLFGPKRAVTVQYDPTFVRSRAHYSHLYWGCSLRALELLARKKGYALIGSNSAGNNAFFVRRDRLNGQPELTAEQAYVESRFRESRDRNGNLNFLAGAARQREIADMPVFDLERNETLRLGELLGA